MCIVSRLNFATLHQTYWSVKLIILSVFTFKLKDNVLIMQGFCYLVLIFLTGKSIEIRFLNLSHHDEINS